MNCPYCHSPAVVKNGYHSVGTPKFLCKACGRQVVEQPKKPPIAEDTKALIDRLLQERLLLAGIARVTGVSERWLQTYVNEKYARIPRQVDVKKKAPGRLTIECDELWSFVGDKGNVQWVWLAIDAESREIVGVAVGDRSRASAEALWQSLPAVYRQCAVCYTDFWESYDTVMPANRHRAVGKASGKTNPIERFNATLRQRVSRWVRKTLSFSNKLENHIGAIGYFIHHYNATLRAAEAV